jgi:YD repeat-containing protein
MKKMIFLLLMTAGFSALIVSCHKPDIPCKKYCQIKIIEDIYNPSPFSSTGRITNYAYNNRRWLDSLTVLPAVGVGTPVNVKINYNNQGNPVGTRTNGNQVHKLIYQNGRVIRVDLLGADNLFHPKYTFLYDIQGRIIERQGQPGSGVLRWEYVGNSKNFVRKLNMQFIRPGEPLEIYMKHEYQYDNKVNPMTTWPNTTLIPFYFEVVENSDHEFEPIPENNCVYQDVTANFRGAQERLHEYIYTYQYDDVYPIKYELMLLTRNPFLFGRVDTTYGTTRFTYDCTNNSNSKQNF